jgi:hypothetical protein
VTDCIDKQPQWLIQNIPPEKGDRVRKFAILLVALSPLVLASSGSGVTVEGESPVDIPEEIEVRRRDGSDPRRSHRGWSEGRNLGWQDYG